MQNDEDSLRSIPVYKAGFRSILLMGVDKRVIIVLSVFSLLAILLWSFNLIAVIGALVFWFVGLKIGQYLCNKDEYFVSVFSRGKQYKDRYPALAYGGKNCSGNISQRYKKGWRN